MTEKAPLQHGKAHMTVNIERERVDLVLDELVRAKQLIASLRYEINHMVWFQDAEEEDLDQIG
jgi:hypothetical protein